MRNSRRGNACFQGQRAGFFRIAALESSLKHRRRIAPGEPIAQGARSCSFRLAGARADENRATGGRPQSLHVGTPVCCNYEEVPRNLSRAQNSQMRRKPNKTGILSEASGAKSRKAEAGCDRCLVVQQTSSSTCSATKMGTDVAMPSAIASLGRLSISTVLPFWRM